MESNLVAFSNNFVLGNRVLVQGRSGSVATDHVCMSIKSNIVATESKTTASSLCDSVLDSGDESKNGNESLQKTYEKMYS